MILGAVFLLSACEREKPPAPLLIPTGGSSLREETGSKAHTPPGEPPPASLAVNLTVNDPRSQDAPPAGKPPGVLGGEKRDSRAPRRAGLGISIPVSPGGTKSPGPDERRGSGLEGRPSRPGSEGDPQEEGSLRRGVAGRRYLSPARPRERKVPEKTAPVLKAAEAPEIAAPGGDLPAKPAEAEPPSVKGLDADILKSAVDPLDEVDNYRVQVSETEGFEKIIFENNYGFMEAGEAVRDMEAAFPKGGKYWVRYAFTDLLDFQHPFSRPKRYRFRPGRRKLIPIPSR